MKVLRTLSRASPLPQGLMVSTNFVADAIHCGSGLPQGLVVPTNFVTDAIHCGSGLAREEARKITSL
ncbi:hypothetical protein J2Y86_002207 [Pseudomonas migulae]|nr:hypothetical protein [Pseudomonas migulae]